MHANDEAILECVGGGLRLRSSLRFESIAVVFESRLCSIGATAIEKYEANNTVRDTTEMRFGEWLFFVGGGVTIMLGVSRSWLQRQY